MRETLRNGEYCTDKVCTDLIEEAHPDLYKKNAFRILGVMAGASERQINRQAQKWMLCLQAGLRDEAIDTPCFLDSPPDREILRQAMQRLRDPARRFVDEFFWFWPVRDERVDFPPSLYRQLLQADAEVSCRIWQKLEAKSDGQIIFFHNLAVLAHALALDLEEMPGPGPENKETAQKRDFFWEKAYGYWEQCIPQEAFWQRIRDMVRHNGDPRITTGFVKRFRESLPLALSQINADYCLRYTERGQTEEVQRHLRWIQDWGLDPDLAGQALRLVSGPMVEQVKHQCQQIRKKIEHQPAKAYEFARMLFDQTEKMLRLLQELLPEQDPNRREALDEAASAVLEILLGELARGGNGRTALVLLEKALAWAATEPIQQRIRDTITALRYELESQPCWFCDEYLASDQTSVVVAPGSLNRQLENTGESNPSSGVWLVRIPRCARCQFVHLRSRLVFFMTCLAGAWLGLVVSYPLSSNAKNPLMLPFIILVSVGAGTYAGWWVGRAMARWLTPEGVKPEVMKYEYPGIQKWMEREWPMDCKPEHVR